MEKYPIYTLEIAKNESRYSNVDGIISYLKDQIAANPVAVYIAEFDHHAHTTSLGGEINALMSEAKMVIFCFGQKLPRPEMMAPRPRSIAVCDMGENFVSPCRILEKVFRRHNFFCFLISDKMQFSIKGHHDSAEFSPGVTAG